MKPFELQLSRWFGQPWPPNHLPKGKCCCGGHCWVFGGNTGVHNIGATQKYTPQSDAFAAAGGSSMTNACSQMGYAAISGKGYIYCGASDSGFIRSCEEFDPENWTLKTTAPLPVRGRPGGCAVSGKAYCFGGNSTGSSLGDVDEYTPGTDAWASKGNITSPNREFCTALEIGTKAYVIAGASSGPFARLQDCDEYDASGDSWANKTDCPAPARRNQNGAVIDAIGYIVGGDNASDPNGTIRDTDAYDPAGNSWSSKTDIPLPARRGPSCATVDGAMYAFSGNQTGSTFISDVDEFTPDTWASKSAIAEAVVDSGAFTL